MNLRALLLDFDGTIVDTESPETEVWSEIFTHYGITFPEEYFTWAVGRGADEIVDRPLDILIRQLDLNGNMPEEFDGEAIEADYHARRMAVIATQPILPGILELLSEARIAHIPTAVVSSSKHVWVDRHLADRGLAHLVDHVVCADDVPRAKPFPDLYLRALDLIGIPATDAIAVEDSPNGVQSAVTAGIFTVAIPNPLTARLDLSHASLQLPTLGGLSLTDLAKLADQA